MTDAVQSAGLVALADRIELWPIDHLRPYERNPRTHSEGQVDQIAASMVEFGWTNPILIDENADILADHGRLLAAPKLDPAEVPVIRFEPLFDGRCGFSIVEPPLPVKPPVHRPAGVRSAAEVKRELDRERPSAARRGYGRRWRWARAAFLAQHPLCAVCRALGRVVPATVVDHVVPHRGDQRLFWGQTNWAPSCKSCHDRKTARQGRWGTR